MVAAMTLTVLLVALIGICSVTDDISIGPLIEAMLIGCIVATAAKGSEMVATMTLTVLLAALNGVNLVKLARPWRELHLFLLPILVFILGDLIMIVAGGGIVRKSRSTAARPSSA